MQIKKILLPLYPQFEKTPIWEFSSAGSEHLPYKQRVGGSNPSTPTQQKTRYSSSVFFLFSRVLCEQAPRTLLNKKSKHCLPSVRELTELELSGRLPPRLFAHRVPRLRYLVGDDTWQRKPPRDIRIRVSYGGLVNKLPEHM